MTRTQQIRDLHSRLGELSADELAQLKQLCFDEYDDQAKAAPSEESVASLQKLGKILVDVQNEETGRAQRAEELEAQAAEARQQIEAIRNPEAEPASLADEGAESTDEGEGDDEGDEGEGAEGADAEAGDGADAEGADLPVPVAASSVTPPHNVGRAAAMTRTRGRARPRPGAQPARGGALVVAAANLRDLSAGEAIADRAVLASAVVDMLSGLHKEDPPSGRHTVARARWDHLYPEDRRLGRDPSINTERISAVCAPQAVVASGGICAPVNVDYSVPTWAVADRPLRDALPAFQADRGGIIYVTPPDIGVPSLQHTPASGLASATSVWTEATDATPGAATKPVYTVTCGAEQTVYVDAIPTRLKFGNMQGRFAPEQIAANTDVAIAAAAREAELNLLHKMFSASKQVVSNPYLGATRDLLAAADVIAEKYRYSHRMGNATLTAVFPEWAKALIRADMTRELAHDNTGTRDVMAISDAQIEEWFSARNISIIWTLDGLMAGTYGTGGTALKNQFFGLQGTAATAAGWPNTTSTATGATVQVGWLLYAEGSFQFLDGGRLTLGVVRDSTLDATNDYETFVETFEGVAFRGLEAYQVLSTVRPTGGSAGTIADSKYAE